MNRYPARILGFLFFIASITTFSLTYTDLSDRARIDTSAWQLSFSGFILALGVFVLLFSIDIDDWLSSGMNLAFDFRSFMIYGLPALLLIFFSPLFYLFPHDSVTVSPGLILDLLSENSVIFGSILLGVGAKASLVKKN